MQRSRLLLLLLIFLIFTTNLDAQRRRTPGKPAVREKSNKAIVVDERLAVLRLQPSLYSKPLQRMRRGRELIIQETKAADGVKFYRVTALPNNFGWVQSDAVVGLSKTGDDERLARLIQGSDNFDKIERAAIFVDNFPNSTLRPSVLLLLGDLSEEIALRLSKDANKTLNNREMAASGAPFHSFFLNYTSLDRYKKLGINFLFNVETKSFHYGGESWREIVRRFPASSEAVEAQKRLDSLKEKLAGNAGK